MTNLILGTVLGMCVGMILTCVIVGGKNENWINETTTRPISAKRLHDYAMHSNDCRPIHSQTRT